MNRRNLLKSFLLIPALSSAYIGKKVLKLKVGSTLECKIGDQSFKAIIREIGFNIWESTNIKVMHLYASDIKKGISTTIEVEVKNYIYDEKNNCYYVETFNEM